jgi:AraC-like DNA-binding protein
MSAPISIVSRDLDEAREIGGSAYFPHVLTCHGDASAFAMQLRSITVGPVLVGVLGYDVEVHIETTRELDTAYEINVPLAGELDCWVGGRYAAGSPSRAVVNGPRCTSTLHGFGPGRPLFGLKVKRDALEAQYRVLHGRPPDGPVELDPYIALDRGGGRQWWALARTLLDGVEDPDGVLGNPMVARPLVDAVLRGLLVVAGPDGAGPQHLGCRPRSLRTALEFVHEHASRPLTVGDIAEAGGCSVRALQDAFQRHLDSTPMAYLHRVRLAGAHADLVAADPEAETVNDVCWRWGFTHAGRFAAAYRRCYGVRPSETLHAK